MDIAIITTPKDLIEIRNAVSPSKDYVLSVQSGHNTFYFFFDDAGLEAIKENLKKNFNLFVVSGEEYAGHYYKGAADCRRDLTEALLKPTCWTCSNPHGQWFEDRSVGIDLHLDDCPHMPREAENIDPTSEDAYHALATMCGHWALDPTKVGPQW